MKKNGLPLLLVFIWTACGDTKQPVLADKHADHTKQHTTIELAGYCDSVNNGWITTDTLKGSPQRTAMATVNGTHVHIVYGSPGVRDRVIWGGLVAWDQVWATGAHKATTVQFSKPVEINHTTVPKGIYALFTIPGKENWVVILNKQYDQHLADNYSAAEDQVRVTVIPEDNSMVPRLTYFVSTIDDSSGAITMQWEKKLIHLPFKTLP